jgi:sugar phosphate isomerase/epimerase
MDIITEDIPPELMGITLDTYWLQASGCDVCSWIERLKDRIPCVHLKDMTIAKDGWAQLMAPVMEGNMNFKQILRKLEETKAVRYILVEQDTCQESPFICLKKSFDNLHSLGYK